MKSISSGDSPPEAIEGQRERLPRTNLLLTATIEGAGVNASVRIRNLSESGALLEGATFPKIGEALTLRRLDLEIGATVIWRAKSRCGVKFDGTVSVAEWSRGTWSAASRDGGQSRVDTIQAAIRAGTPPMPTGRTGSVPTNIDGTLDRRIAEELAQLRRLLETVGDELTDEPIIVQRHPTTLQAFDLASQTLGHLAAILTSEDRGAAVNAVGMEDLRARLLRKPVSEGY